MQHLQQAEQATEQEIAALDHRRAELVLSLANIRAAMGKAQDATPRQIELAQMAEQIKKKRRERRTNAEIERLRKEIRNEVHPTRRQSSEIFYDLVQREVLQDIRKDRDFTMRELKDLVNRGEIDRDGDWLFESDRHLANEPF